MNLFVFLATCAAGGIGAAVRFLIDGLIQTRFVTVFPVGTLVINVTGSFILGLVTGLTASGSVPAEWLAILGAGFAGGYTTFSTASFETIRLAQRGKYAMAATNMIVPLILAIWFGIAGLWIGTTIWL